MPRICAYVAATGDRSKGPGAASVEVVEGSPTWFVIPMFTVHTRERNLSHYILADDAQVPTVPARLSLTRLFLELVMYKEALGVLTDIIMTDDQEVEAWYLEGWCFMLMGEDAKEKGIRVEDLSWDELARDARDCLETCRRVSSIPPPITLVSYLSAAPRKPTPPGYCITATRPGAGLAVGSTGYRASQ
jgi:hypothetical protein